MLGEIRNITTDRVTDSRCIIVWQFLRFCPRYGDHNELQQSSWLLNINISYFLLQITCNYIIITTICTSYLAVRSQLHVVHQYWLFWSWTLWTLHPFNDVHEVQDTNKVHQLRTSQLRVLLVCVGNDNIHLLTSQTRYRLRIDLEDFAGNTRYAEYDNFKVGSMHTKYKLVSLGTYSGTAGQYDVSCLVFITFMEWHVQNSTPTSLGSGLPQCSVIRVITKLFLSQTTYVGSVCTVLVRPPTVENRWLVTVI